MIGGALVDLAIGQLDLRLQSLRSCPESAVNALVESLQRHGQLTPLVVAEDRTSVLLVDGFKRLRAAQRLGLETLQVMVLPHQGALMKSHMYLLNRKNGFSLVEEALLIRELVKVDGLKQVEVAALLERHKSWVCRRLEMIDALLPALVADIQCALLPPGSGFALARLPQCNQADVGAAIQRHQLKTTEVHRLVDLWCRAPDEEARGFLLRSPRQALELSRAEPAESRDPRLPQGLSDWLKTVQTLERVALAVRLKSKKLTAALEAQARPILQEALEQAERECRQALAEANALVAKGHDS